MVRQFSIVVLAVGAVTALSSLAGCSGAGGGELPKGEHMPTKTIEQVLDEKTDEWMTLPGVVGTAVGMFAGKPCIKIFTSEDHRELRARIPSTVEGYPVIIEGTGAFRALDGQ